MQAIYQTKSFKISQCLLNTSPRFFIQPALAMAVWKSKGLYFLVRQEHPVSK